MQQFWSLEGDFIVQVTIKSVGATWAQVLPADPSRFAVSFGYTGNASIWLAPQSLGATLAGIQLTSGSPNYDCNFRDMPNLPNGQWWAITSGTNTLVITEILYRPAGAS